MWIGPVVGALVGLVLLFVGLRGKRINLDPWCRRCKYSLAGLPEPAACPECGADLAGGRAIRVGQRRKLRLVIGLGATIMVALLATAGWLGWRKAVDFDWNTVKPVWWLKRDSTSSDNKAAAAAREELLRRLDVYAKSLTEDGLSASQIRDIVDHALVLQADPATVWSAQWGRFVERAWYEDVASYQQIRRYLRYGFQPGIQMKARQRVRRGAFLPVKFEYPRCRTAAPSLFTTTLIVEDARLGDQEVLTSLLLTDPREMSSLNRWSEVKRLPVDLEPGQYTLTVRYRVVVTEYLRNEAVVEWIDALESEVEILPYSTESITPVTGYELRDDVRAAITVRPIRTSEVADSFFVGGLISLQPPPVDLAFDVHLRVGTTELKVGWFTAIKGRGMEDFETVMRDPFDLLPASQTVDVVLRPNLSLAEASLDVMDVWFEEVIFEDVPVR